LDGRQNARCIPAGKQPLRQFTRNIWQSWHGQRRFLCEPFLMNCSLRAALTLLIITATAALAEEPASPAPIDFNLYMQGRYVYERNCIICHGERGDGKGEFSASLQPPPSAHRSAISRFSWTPRCPTSTAATKTRTCPPTSKPTSMPSAPRSRKAIRRGVG